MSVSPDLPAESAVTLRMHADPPPGWKLAIVCDGKSRYFRVAAVRPGNGGYNEYDLEPAEVDARTCRYQNGR